MAVSSEYIFLLSIGKVISNSEVGTHLSHLVAKRDRLYLLYASGVLDDALIA